MINDPRWVTIDHKVAHLLTTSHYVGMPNSGEREAWCGVRIDGPRASETETVRRCGGCLRKLSAFSSSALAPIPDRVRETVTIVVERPVTKRIGSGETGEETALELVHRALDRRKTWEVISAQQVSIESVDVEPVEEDRMVREGTADEPTIVTAEEAGKLSQEAISILKHVHTEDGQCVKNRFGHRCSA